MSLKYRDHNGVSRIISGITPGGNMETGAVATREGTATNPTVIGQGGSATASVTFSEPMPDADYNVDCTSWDGSSAAIVHIDATTVTQNGFSLIFRNTSTSGNIPAESVTVHWKAFKLYTVADAEALYSTVQDIEAMVPNSASSTNKFATANDLRTETRSLDRRLDDVEDVIPSDADISNKLVTESDLSNVQIDKVEDINDVELTDIADGQTLVWDGTNSKWINGEGGKTYTAGDGIEIDSNDAISVADTYKTIFVGTRAQWDALSATDKIKYQEAHITDDVIGGEVADVVQDGLMSPVTSNAVYDALLNYKRIGNVFFSNNFLADASTHIATVTHTITIAGTYVIYVNGNPYATDTDMTATIQKNGSNIAFNSILNSAANNYAGIVSFATEQFDVNDTITIGLTGATQVGTYNHYVIFRIA